MPSDIPRGPMPPDPVTVPSVSSCLPGSKRITTLQSSAFGMGFRDGELLLWSDDPNGRWTLIRRDGGRGGMHPCH